MPDMGQANRSATISVSKLRKRAGVILRKVRDTGESVDITYRGVVVARIVPAEPHRPDTDTSAGIWTDLDSLAAEISRLWPSGVSAAKAVSEARR